MPDNFKVQSKQKANRHTQRINSFIPTRVCANIRKTKISLPLCRFHSFSRSWSFYFWHASVACVVFWKKVNLKSATNLCKHSSIFLSHLLSTSMNINIHRSLIANRLENSDLIQFGKHMNANISTTRTVLQLWPLHIFTDEEIVFQRQCLWSIRNSQLAAEMRIAKSISASENKAIQFVIEII